MLDAQTTIANELFGMTVSLPIAFPETSNENSYQDNADSSIEMSSELDNMYMPNYVQYCKLLNLLLVNGSLHQLCPMLT